jgi:hypothetical protein
MRISIAINSHKEPRFNPCLITASVAGGRANADGNDVVSFKLTFTKPEKNRPALLQFL